MPVPSSSAKSLAELLPEPMRRLGAWCVLLLLVTGVAAVGIWLCVELKTAVTPILLAVLGTALLRPLYSLLVHRVHVQRSLAAGITCAAVVAAVGGAGYIVTSAIVDNGQQILDSIRSGIEDAASWVGAEDTSLDDITHNARQLLNKFGGTAATGVINGLSVVGSFVATAVLALLLMFFFLRDAGRALRGLRELSPGDSSDLVEAMARRAYQAVAGFMHGTTIIALIDATFITIGLLVLGVPGALGLGALVFLGAYIPYLGAFLSGAVAILVALADRGFVIALWVLGVVLAVQVLEGHLLQPVVQSRTVQMHPAVVMVTITAGASLAGILGMLLAVPLTAAAFGIFRELRERYGDGGGASAEAPGDTP
ncbi:MULTISPECIES: AI-2E family transporter [Streptomyces]|uniref:AI-2E family transporter n=1 Tax=Streptomyces evansiae TaxID=3075535 RepID=A0ABU2R451_9ACTN|nr:MULTISPECIES: AI-2E family transporter [unclassified Streptomyces]MDT0411031.1 AI-2E family transporter [Streptomyces sp. DSM 41979]MYQ58058.1 AI-2E family transporter [Streptomyces sp. SID4926]